MTINWHEFAKQLQETGFENRLFINGKYCKPVDDTYFEEISPVTKSILTKVAAASHKDVDLAVQAARKAFESGSWRLRSPAERKEIMLKLATLIDKNKEELALLQTLEMGKPIKQSLDDDLPSVVNCCRWYAEAIDKIYQEVAPTSFNNFATITREPLGVVAIIIPWNFPLLMLMWKLAPALAMGNSIIIKPAEESSLSALKLASLFKEAGIDDGVINILPGRGEITGQALGMHSDVDGAFFTGSTEIGKIFLQYSAASNMKKVALECGGKSAHIILDDCSRLEEAAKVAAEAIFLNHGQVCSAGSRLLIHKNIQEEFLSHLLQAAKNYELGDPLNENTVMSSLVNKTQKAKVIAYIEKAIEEGATLLLGDSSNKDDNLCVKPTIFTNVQPNMTIAQEEIFGPVLSVITIENHEEALTIANSTQYGLAAAVWSDDINKLHYMSKNLKAGMVFLNCYFADDITVPFGGYKQSGIGRDKSLHAFDKYCEIKTTWLSLNYK